MLAEAAAVGRQYIMPTWRRVRKIPLCVATILFVAASPIGAQECNDRVSRDLYKVVLVILNDIGPGDMADVKVIIGERFRDADSLGQARKSPVIVLCVGSRTRAYFENERRVRNLLKNKVWMEIRASVPAGQSEAISVRYAIIPLLYEQHRDRRERVIPSHSYPNVDRQDPERQLAAIFLDSHEVAAYARLAIGLNLRTRASRKWTGYFTFARRLFCEAKKELQLAGAHTSLTWPGVELSEVQDLVDETVDLALAHKNYKDSWEINNLRKNRAKSCDMLPPDKLTERSPTEGIE